MLWSIMSFICYSSLIAGAIGGSAMLIRDFKEDIKMSDKKTSWEYEKARNSKQIRIVFNLDDPIDAQVFHYLERYKPNRTSFIKRLVYDELVRCAYEQA